MKTIGQVTVFLVAGALPFFMGCAFLDKDETVEARQLYQQARNALINRRYTSADEKYTRLKEDYPFSSYSQRADVEHAYTAYKMGSMEKTVLILDNFIKVNPDWEHIDYAYYLQGLAYYNYNQSFVHKVIPLDVTDKDPSFLVDGFFIFRHLYENYPDSIYAEDAKLHMIALRNMLAVHEIRIADFYMRKGAYVATANRIKYMLENYHGAQHTPEGLVLLAAAYEGMGLEKSAEDTLRVLHLNYPDYHKKKIDEYGRITKIDEKNWFAKLKDMSDKILEALSVKPKY